MSLPITYSTHARQRMRERGVSEAQVERTVHNPDNVTLQANGRLSAERRAHGGIRLRVVYEERLSPDLGRHAVIVTVIRN